MTDERPRGTKTSDRKRASEPERAATITPMTSRPRPIPPLPARVTHVGGAGSGQRGVPGEMAPAPGTISPTGTGQDARHRGWYWHWNTLITQFAPIVGLKGVALLNSYTVWTDRREGSPHQGFAFPAQESEARFYGEGREELITLNKVLVALDLIEIHKEMVVRQDERGRRWRVPHNFYRVKDPKDGLVLSLPAVVRVLELAQQDRNVFRQVRHIFGPQFTPIDRTSLWHSLLPELRALPLWTELEARAARERRAPRNTGTAAPTTPARPEASKPRPPEPTIVNYIDRDSSSIRMRDDTAHLAGTTLSPTTGSVGDTDHFKATTDRDTDTASIVLPRARASTDKASPSTLVPRPIPEPSRPIIGSMKDEGMTNIEEGGHRSVAHADSMYYQSGETKEETTSTSSTTSRARADADAYEARSDTIPAALSPPRPSVSDLFAALEAQRVYEPIEDASPPEQPDAWDQIEEEPRSHISPENREAAAPVMLPSTASGQPLPPEPGEPEEGVIVVRAVAVTDQPAIGTDERNLLTEIESALTMTNSRPPSDMEMSLYWQIARDCDDAARNQPGPGSGLGWVLAAITEAVYSSGSGRVAPKYVARICERWTADGYMSDGRTPPVFAVPAPPPQWPLAAAIPAALTVPARAPETEDSPPTPSPADTMLTDAELARLWPAVVRRLEGILPSDSLKARWFTEARVLSVVGERATVQASDAETALKLTNYRGLISRRLSDVLGRPIEAVFQAAPPLPPEPDTAMPAADSADGAPGIAPEVSSLPPQTSTRVNTMSTNYAPAPMPSPWSWPAAGSGASSQTAPLLPAEITPRAAMGSGPIPVVPPLTRSEATSAASVSPKPVRVVSREQPLEAGSASASLSVLSSSVPTFAVAGSDETNREIWPRVLARLREGLTDVTFKVWMEPTALIAIDADGTFVIGARNRVQRERLERQHAADIAAALSALLDRAVPVRIAVIGE